LPVLTFLARECGPPFRTEVIDCRSLPAPVYESTVAVPGAVSYTVTADRPSSISIDGAAVEVGRFDVRAHSFAVRAAAGDPHAPILTVSARLPFDAAAAVEAFAALSALTPAEDALLCAAALCGDPSACADAALRRLAPSVPPAAARFRANVHRAMRAPAIELPDFPHGRWLAPPHAEWPRPRVRAVLPRSADGERWFVGLARLLPIAPIDRGTIPPREPPIWDALFERVGKDDVLVPRADADLEGLVGVGRWLAWLWRAGKPLRVRIARAVVRVAFGGTIGSDDTDGGGDRWVGEREVQLSAIRAGVVAAGLVVDDDVIVPRLFEIRSFRVVHGQVKVADPFVTPLVRRAMADENIAVWGKRAELIDGIIERFE
jgi:hypothetical protein